MPSDTLYAHNIMVFFKGDIRYVKVIRNVLDKYAACFRIWMPIHVYVGCESKVNTNFDHVLKYNDSTSECKLLNNWV